ncbi:MAG: hypothetical protein HY835_00140 [Anaerolineae bacterium]|nr:hypothetical protein [Anaerolineae bacterium]
MKRKSCLIHQLIRFIIILSCILVPTSISGAQGPIDEGPGATPESPPVLPESLLPDVVRSKVYSGGPAFDSGWISLRQDESKVVEHNLGGSEGTYVVDMQYRAQGVDGTNLRYYGGVDFGASPGPGHAVDDRVGAYWRSLTAASITVYRRPEDTYAEQVRIRIWIDAGPNYDSGWASLATDETRTLSHNLGGSADDYVVDMQFKSAASGINQRCFGGCDLGALTTIGSPDDRLGAYWRTLTNTQITIYRRPEDTFAEQVRIRIWLRPQPTYDSGWRPINQNAILTLAHNIGGSADDYQIIMDFKAADVNGINTRAFGGMDMGTKPPIGHGFDDRVGAYWRSLTDSSIIVYRRPEDDYAPQVRIRIFRFLSVPPPDYDSGWRDLSQDTALTLTHNLGGEADDYMVDMLYRSPSVDGINHRYLGGSDFGDWVDIGNPNDRVGAYWRSLTSSSIIIYRRPEDTYAPQIRIRIWKMPKPDYDSDWVAKAPGEAATTLNHNLGGDYQNDYLVYFDYKNATDGINQRYYGGADFGTLSFSGAANNDRTGAFWHQLTNTTAKIYRRPEDIYAEQLRLRIWRIHPPDYNSGWISLNKNQAITLNHNLGDLPGAYLMQMLQWDTNSENSLNHRHYGGADFGNLPPAGIPENARVGSYWRSLTAQSVAVYRRPDDEYADYVMVRIWDLTRKTYLPVINR